MTKHRRFRIPASVLAAAAGFLVAARVAAGDDAPPRAGMRAYVDPDTGQLSTPPAGTPPPAPRLQGPAPALVETPGTSPAGGASVRVGDAFRTTVRATVGPDGHVTTRCQDDRARQAR